MYLIRRELPKEFAASYRWSLVKLKVSDGDSPYIAFESASAASEFIATRPTLAACSAVESSRIGLNTYLGPDVGTLLFSSVEQLDGYLSGGMQQQIRRASIPTRNAFEGTVRRVKDWYAAWHSRKLVHEG